MPPPVRMMRKRILVGLLWFCAGATIAQAAGQPALGSRESPLLTLGGLQFRDLNRNGVRDEYEDWRLAPGVRAHDLLARMTLEEKAGAMMHATAPMIGGAAPGDARYDAAEVERLIRESHVTSFITRLTLPAVRFAEENNRLQAVAERGRLGVPLLISTDPRNHFSAVLGASVAANGFSQWPQPLGLASSGDPALVKRFADVARREYRAVGIRMALSPQADLATEPRWSRINGTFGEDPALVSRMVRAYVAGFQHGERGLTTESVATVVKHWVGYGAAEHGFDGHHYFGRFSSFPGQRFADHVRAFDGAFRARTAGVMPTYNVLLGVNVGGRPLEPVAAGFNRQLLTELLRGKQRFDGLILSDWGITNDCDSICLDATPERPAPMSSGRPWGLEKASKVERFVKGVEAGLDQFGGTTDADVLVEAVSSGRLTEARLDESVLRILAMKFQLGLFENPYVNADKAARIVGAREFQEMALDAQRRSLVLLENGRKVLPLARGGHRVFSHGIAVESLATYGLMPVDDPAQADVAIVRVTAPAEREGSLEPGTSDVDLITATAAKVPTVVIVHLERPAILTQIRNVAAALLVEFGASDQAVLDVLAGKARPRGRLPFELPSSMSDVEAELPDVPHDTRQPLYPIFFGRR